MRKPTVIVVVEMGCTDEQRKRVEEALATLNTELVISLSPVMLNQNEFGVDPFAHIDCPACGSTKFCTTDLAKVECDNCLAEFKVRATSGDSGFVVDCVVNGIGSEIKHSALFNHELYRVVKYNGDEDSGWLVKGNPYGITPLDEYLKENVG